MGGEGAELGLDPAHPPPPGAAPHNHVSTTWRNNPEDRTVRVTNRMLSCVSPPLFISPSILLMGDKMGHPPHPPTHPPASSLASPWQDLHIDYHLGVFWTGTISGALQTGFSSGLRPLVPPLMFLLVCFLYCAFLERQTFPQNPVKRSGLCFKRFSCDKPNESKHRFIDKPGS